MNGPVALPYHRDAENPRNYDTGYQVENNRPFVGVRTSGNLYLFFRVGASQLLDGVTFCLRTANLSICCQLG